MDTLADAGMPPPSDPAGRSFALLAESERARMGTLLRPLPWIDGLIAATLVASAALDEPDDNDEEAGDAAFDWLYMIWKEGCEAEVGALSMEQTAETVDPVIAHYVHVGDTLYEEPEEYHPYLAGAADPFQAASLWGAGFWAGLAINPVVWGPLLADEDALPLLVAILSLVRDEDMPDNVRDDPDSPFRDMPADKREHMRRSTLDMLPEIVLSLHDYALGLDDAEEAA